MRRVLIYFICVLFACSCNNGKKQAELARQQAYADSIAEANRQAELAEQRRIDSLADCAIGDIRFGMSSEDIIASNLLMNCEVRKENVYREHDRLLSSIDGLGEVTFELDYDRLYCVFLKSNGEFYHSTRNEMTLIIDQINRYIKLFSEKYGDPIMLHKIPKPDNFMSLPRIYEICYWNIGNKHIGICIEKQDNYFRAITEIENNQYVIEFWSKDVEIIDKQIKQKEEDNKRRDRSIIQIL